MRLLFLCVLLSLAGCTSDEKPVRSEPATVRYADQPNFGRSPVVTGAEVLARDRFRRLAGKRVGLVANHTAVVGGVHLIDLMQEAPDVDLAALFGPEHGLRGEAGAGERVVNGRDERTGIPVYSLYGRTNKPTLRMLRGLDVLVFDIQDIGARFYTYISTMGLAMQAAAEAGIPFIVLDRPNPLGGRYVSGWVLEPEWASFVGKYPIPIAHGLTVGELARMIKGEKMLAGLERLELQVVPMEGWQRWMLWHETGLPWLAPSPNIPTFATALVYPGSCLFEAASASEGRGTRHPFEWIGMPGADGRLLADTLNGRGLPGVRFEPVSFTPEDIPGMAANPKLEGKRLSGVRYVLTDTSRFMPVETGVHVLDVFARYGPQEAASLISRPEWLAALAGTDRLLGYLRRSTPARRIVQSWSGEVDAFRQARRAYLIYP